MAPGCDDPPAPKTRKMWQTSSKAKFDKLRFSALGNTFTLMPSPCAAMVLAAFLLRRRWKREPSRAVHAKTLMSMSNDSNGTSGDEKHDALVKGLVLARHASEIDPSEFVICKDEHGDDMCLGEGNFGKVSRCMRACYAIWQA